MEKNDVLVIGKGMFGSAAARHLAQMGARVTVMGPDEPPDSRTHTGVFASHYDQGRLALSIGRDGVWTTLACRSLESYGALEAGSGIRFHEPRGALQVAAPGQTHRRLENVARLAPRFGVQARVDEPGLAADFPYYAFPDESRVAWEGEPAGFINPRDLIRAQLTLAESAGAQIVPQIVRGIETGETGVTVHTADGTFTADRALLAAGAYTNSPGLLPRPLALRVKSETIILSRLTADRALPLAQAPVVSYAIDSRSLEGIYLVPPVRYPDGQLYVKMGANTVADRWLRTPEEMNDWVRNGDSDVVRNDLRLALYELLPDTLFEGVETRRCLVTYTPQDKPFIDAVDERLYVVAGGNGTGAHLSGAVGALAAALMAHGKWSDTELDPASFQVRYADEVGWAAYVGK